MHRSGCLWCQASNAPGRVHDMGRKSSIDRLPAHVKAEIDAALKRGATLDEVVAAVQALGADISRSAVGRYAQKAEEVAKTMREAQAISAQLAPTLAGMADAKTGRLINEMFQTLVFNHLIKAAREGDDAGSTSKDLMQLGRAIKESQQAANLDVAREMKIRDDERRQAREAAVAAVEKVARTSGGLTRETIDAIRAEILGVTP